MAASGTLEYWSGLEFTIVIMAATRAYITIWPPIPKEGLLTLLLGSILSLEIDHTQTRLKLNSIFGHGIPLLLLFLGDYPIPGVSYSEPL